MMQYAWRVWVASVVAVVVVAGVEQSEDRWVWGQSRKASSIPGYVEPSSSTSTTTTTTTTPTTTTPEPPITTYRTPFRGMRRGMASFPRASANPYLLGPFSPFSLVPVRATRPAADGTTKSRVTADTAFDGSGGAVLDAGDKYTTLDRLQQERGAPPALPRPEKHQLGGLHPDEVFYADDDLIIIKGGGFHSQPFREPLQPLDEDDEGDVREGSPTEVVPVVAAPPSPSEEYNGNIPAIVPPPTAPQDLPYSLFVEGASRKNYILVPHVFPRPAHRWSVALGASRRPVAQVPYRRHKPHNRVRLVPRPSAYSPSFSPAQLQAPEPLALPHSLVGDTDVNYLYPRPAINPDAEVLLQNLYPGRPRPLL